MVIANMARRKPHLSIGIPVFNGEKYLEDALDSILSQTYSDFELIISDNASTDKTPQICLRYAKKDKRIHYYQNTKNVGAPANYNLTFKLSSGDYFKWAAHDDLLAPDYLKRCVEVLDNDETIVLCHSKIGRIDENSVLVGNFDDSSLNNISSPQPHERFGAMISRRNSCWMIMGVMRAKCLSRTPLHGSYIDADRNLLAELSLMGRVYEIPEHLFFVRYHPQSYTSTYYSKSSPVQDYRRQLFWWTGKRRGPVIVLPHWKNFLEYFRSSNRVSLTLSERWLCYREIGRWLLKEKGYQLMKWDLTNEFEFWRTKLRYS